MGPLAVSPVARAVGLRQERLRACPRFDGQRFHNTRPVAPGLRHGTALATLRELALGGQQRVPPGPLPVLSPLAPWTAPPETGLRATWLGHSTVLLEVDGVRLLTDPVWGERVSPVGFAGPRRFHPVPARLAELPPLDAVLLSHDHYDHLCEGTVRELARVAGRGASGTSGAASVPFITSLGVGARLERLGVAAERIVELDWWEHTEVRGVRVTAAPAQHFSGRSLGDRNSTAWSSFHVRGPRHAVFFSGDTGLTPEYADIRQRLGASDLVLLEVGAFNHAWGDIHLGPENALRALELLGGGTLLPVHWGTFNLALHGWSDPAEELLALAAPRAVPLALPRLGEPIEPARVERVDPWWRGVAAAERVVGQRATLTSGT